MSSAFEANNMKMLFICLIEAISVLYMSDCVTTHDVVSTCLIVSISVHYCAGSIPGFVRYRSISELCSILTL